MDNTNKTNGNVREARERELHDLRVEEKKLEIERLKNREKRDQEEHEAKMTREREEHEAHMARSNESHTASMHGMAALASVLTGLSECTPALAQAADAWATKYRYGTEEAIRANACALINKSAGQGGENPRKAASELLGVIGRKGVDQ